MDEPTELDAPANYRAFIARMEALPPSHQGNHAIKYARDNLRRALAREKKA